MRPATILVVEDHASVRRLLARVLEDAGYQVCEAATGREGLQRFMVSPIDLVLTDLEMPELNGLDVIRELTRLCVDVKIIAMSGISPEALQQAKRLGARQTIAKPIDLAVLLHAVQEELQPAATGG